MQELLGIVKILKETEKDKLSLYVAVERVIAFLQKEKGYKLRVWTESDQITIKDSDGGPEKLIFHFPKWKG